MDEKHRFANKKEVLFSAGQKIQTMVDLDLARGINYSTLMEIKGELEALGIIVSITNGGISFSLSKGDYDAAEAVVAKYHTELAVSDFKKHDGDGAGRSDVTENKKNF